VRAGHSAGAAVERASAPMRGWVLGDREDIRACCAGARLLASWKAEKAKTRWRRGRFRAEMVGV